MEVLKCDEKTAEQELERISKENSQVTDDGSFDAAEDSDVL